MTGHTSQSDSRLTRRQRGAFALIAVVCIILAGAAVVTAQQQSFSDDFEDGQADGWSGEFSVEPVSTNGQWSMHQTDSEVENRVPDSAVWDNGPLVDLNESFTITGTVQPVSPSAQTGGVRFGMVDQNLSEELRISFGLNQQNRTYLTYNNGTGEGDVPSEDFVSDNFNGEWANVELNSPDGEDVLYGKVWENGSPEPENYQMDISMDGFAGQVSVQAGELTRGREIYLDDVQLEEVTIIEGSEDLRLDVPGLLRPNTTSHYTVEANQSGTWEDVTDEAEITVEDPDAATFYPSNGTVVATNDTDYANVTNVTAEYDGLNQSEKMVVARPTVENLDILPTWWKVNATLGDGMMLWLIVATLAAVVATRAATSFAGVGAYVMFMIAGWMTGSVSDGVMVATILTGLFLGMNLAANVDTTIRGSG